MQIEKKLAAEYPVIASSKNPQNVSLTVKAVAGLLVSLLALTNIEITQIEIETWLFSLTSAFFTLQAIYGAVRRWYYNRV